MLTRHNLRQRDWARYQDITVFDRDIGELMRVPYPTAPDGESITPGGVHRFLARRGLTWECECARYSDRDCSVRWVGGANRSTGLCTNDPPLCGLHLDLDRIVVTTTFRHTYVQFPTLVSIANAWNRNCWPEQARARRTRSSFPGASNARTQILGSRSTILAASVRPLELVRQRARLSLPQPLTTTRRAPVSGSSNARLPSAAPSSPSTQASSAIEHNEQEVILLRLMRGESISHFESLDLIERCDGCRRYFLNVHLRRHVPTCVNDDEDDIMEDLRRYQQRELSVEV